MPEGSAPLSLTSWTSKSKSNYLEESYALNKLLSFCGERLTEFHMHINFRLKKVINLPSSFSWKILRWLVIWLRGFVYLVERVRILGEYILSARACHLFLSVFMF